jgi:hypothetical protein
MRVIIIINCIIICVSCNLPNNKDKSRNKSPYADTLIDFNSGTKFYIDTSHTFVYAYNNKGELLWKTDPWEDNNLKVFGDPHPKIEYLKFVSGVCDTSKEIEIGYNNKLGGCLNKLTGKFGKMIKD